MGTMQFSYGKRAIFCKVKEIKALRGGVHRYAAQARPQIDAEIAKKGRFRIWSPPFLQGLCIYDDRDRIAAVYPASS
jgi:hypothetical protein